MAQFPVFFKCFFHGSHGLHGSQGQVEKLHLAASGRAPQVSVRIGASGTLVVGPSENENTGIPGLKG